MKSATLVRIEKFPCWYCGFAICSRQNALNHDSFGSASLLPPEMPYEGAMYDGPEPGGAERRAMVVVSDTDVTDKIQAS